MNKKILFISGSLGLGHITRDIAIARELRKLRPNITIDWIAVEPADIKLKEAGENILPESKQYANENIIADKTTKEGNLNLAYYIYNSQKAWKNNVKIYRKLTENNDYDLVIGDETYDLKIAINDTPTIKKAPFIMIWDFVGVEPMTINPLEKLICYYFNRVWAKDFHTCHTDLSIFVGELEDVPDKKFGPFLPNRRDYAQKRMNFVGYIVPFDPEKNQNKQEQKKTLGYSENPLILCTVGGTSIGRRLIELCGKSYEILRERIEGLQMIVVAGPSIDKTTLSLPEGINLHGYLSNFVDYMAASDLVVTQAGGGTTLELAALNKVFIYFPVEGHFEQEVHVSNRLMRHGVGTRMILSDTSPELLAEEILSQIGSTPKYDLPVDGAVRAARLISSFL